MNAEERLKEMARITETEGKINELLKNMDTTNAVYVLAVLLSIQFPGIPKQRTELKKQIVEKAKELHNLTQQLLQEPIA